MQTVVLNHSIENKNSFSVVLELEELSCVRFVQMKYTSRAVVDVYFAKTLDGNWINVARNAIVTHSKLRRVKTGSLPARFVRIDFVEGEVRLVLELMLYGAKASDLKLDLEPEDTELYLNKPYTFIYN
jgi:hypothetical protein